MYAAYYISFDGNVEKIFAIQPVVCLEEKVFEVKIKKTVVNGTFYDQIYYRTIITILLGQNGILMWLCI